MNGHLQIVPVLDDLPREFEALRVCAETEQTRNMTRLADNWRTGTQRFTLPGERLLAAFVDDRLAGVGGITVEPSPALPHALRMRRFYVAPARRGKGIGRALATALMQEALLRTPTLTVHAGRSEGEGFWLAMGFRPDQQNGWTHRYGV